MSSNSHFSHSVARPAATPPVGFIPLLHLIYRVCCNMLALFLQRVLQPESSPPFWPCNLLCRYVPLLGNILSLAPSSVQPSFTSCFHYRGIPTKALEAAAGHCQVCSGCRGFFSFVVFAISLLLFDLAPSLFANYFSNIFFAFPLQDTSASIVHAATGGKAILMW